tara:strand:+ start:332 stop:1183 length:852 start_codon:yes stop_codon:yes gene_type:complete
MSDIEKIKKLRQSTGAGFKDCNLAIEEADGDLDKAVEILRVKGISKASKKMSREANEGVVALTEKENKISLIEVNCETDFVAKNEDFVKFVKELSEINSICEANINKIKSHKMQNSKSVDENLVEIIAKIGEKITIGRSKTFLNSSNLNFKYSHTVVKDNLSKLAVIVSIETKDRSDKINSFGKQLAMHIAASNPLSIDIDGIDVNILKKEEELVAQELKSSGKSDDIIKKISLGKINKFKEENSLLNQAWVIEPKKKVREIIKDLNISDLKIKEFYRLKIGE